ncbi:autotransporter outer membrane beta-barrel domain-containing protein [Entomomonas asaccharolytica]|uniref:Autotransporter outer membrane beta-barrel domain-containing protein n=1 Tax=Entomomonas asaccharolytica TaxID=2785331 RepID=A0A974NGT6_9GAMM|nr:autotransporter outer membrane beta-barrel domain-containing protein [Entomomonas asaccharolytica]QQP86117.1 autotransporter outer membrane beta-barrel domain-containing protein [Entomomonas asaccharolytica]
MAIINVTPKFLSFILSSSFLSITCQATNYIANDGNHHDLSNDSYYSTNSGWGNGAIVSTSSTVAGDNLYLESSHSQSVVAYAAQGGEIHLSNSTINHTSPAASQTYALYSQGEHVTHGSSYITISNSTITTANNSITAVHAEHGGKIHLKDNTAISTGGNYAYGILSRGTGSNTGDGSKITADQLTVITTGDNAYAIHAVDLGEIDIANANVSTTGANSMGLYASNGLLNASNSSINTTGSAAHGVSAVSTTVELDKVNITTSGNLAYGARVNNASLVVKNSTINSSGTSAAALASLESNQIDISASHLIADDWTAICFSHGGDSTLNLTDGSTVNSNIGQAILVEGSTTTAQVNLDNKTVINGTASAASGSTLDLSINNSSVLNGNTSNVNQLNLASLGRWIFDTNNSIAAMDNSGGIVQFNSSSVNPISLTIKDLSGAGTFVMKTDIANLTGDLLVVTDNSAGSHKISIANNGTSITDGTEVLTVVETTDGIGKFSLTNRVEAGGYEYSLLKDGTNWILYSGGRLLTSTANAAIGFFNTGYLSNYIENQTLLQRLGDLRNQSEKTNTGFWIRSYGGKLNSFSGQGTRGFDMPYVGTQGGIDNKVELANADLIVGGVLGFTRGNPNYDGGNGTIKNYHLGMYATYYHNNGIYVDGLVKYNNTHNHFSVNDTAGTRVKGTAKTQGYSVSLEAGKRFMAQPKLGIYIEPQVQVTYAYQNGDRMHASNGLKVDLKNYNSTQGRAGVNLGYQSMGKSPINIYLKGNFTREMDGRTAYKLNGSKHKYSLRSNWKSGGIGGSINLNKNHNIYADAEYTKGGRFNQRQLNLGYSYRI